MTPILTNAEIIGIQQELRSGELSEDQELELPNRIIKSEQIRQGILTEKSDQTDS